MLPIKLDHQNLNSLPLPTDKAINRVFQSLQAILSEKIIPHFGNRNEVSFSQLSNMRRNLFFRRMQDEDNRTGLATLLVRHRQNWTILIHERLFDLLAFVLPFRTELSASGGTSEEQKLLAFSELFLRHHLEHIVFPKKNEFEVIRSDMEYLINWSKSAPTSYRMLRDALAEGMTGIKGKDFLNLLNRVERGEDPGFGSGRVVAGYTREIAGLPGRFLLDLFSDLDCDTKIRVLNACYRTSRSATLPLVKRAASLRRVLRLFALSIRNDQTEGLELFKAFKKRWGLEPLFHELDLTDTLLAGRSIPHLFDIFKKSLEEFVEPGDIINQESSMVSHEPRVEPAFQQTKSLKERIEEARVDPDVPQQVIELIEKNKMNAAGQSGAKYTELIETLLAIPWGKIKKIWISPEEFEDGLNRSHYGLGKPKEIVCDFFANLIWRYQHFRESEKRHWHRTGSALLFVGPPGVGKTSLAISIARNLGIPYHKLSLGGMKDEADIRGYGFTYEGSKPGPIVQGLIKMGAMNGMFIMDEADKTEKFAIATLLEILDPEQNHLFHDKYTQSTVDIDLSNCHFILTANTLDTVPSAILNRCEVIFLDRYSVEEKIAIARNFLLHRVRERYLIGHDEIYFDPEEESDILRHLIRDYTFEAGVRDLERIVRTLFLRVQRKEIMGEGKKSVKLTLTRVHKHLDEPNRPRLINEDDRIGEMMGLGVNMEMGVGTLIPIQVTPMKSGGVDKKDISRNYMSMVHTTGNIERVMDESRKVASTAIMQRAGELRINPAGMSTPVHLHFMGGSTKKDGPSAGGAIALALASLFGNRKIRRDTAMTGEIDTQGRITSVGGIAVKLETAYAAGCKTLIIPRENLKGNDAIERLPDALKQELQILTHAEWKGRHEPFDYNRHMLQVVAVDDIVQASEIVFIDQNEIDSLDNAFEEHARRAAKELGQNDPKPFKRLRIAYLDDPAEVDSDLLQSEFCSEDYGCLILVRSDVKEELYARLPEPDEKLQIREFDPSSERMIDVVRTIVETYSGVHAPPLRISMVAPLSFLRREGMRSDDFARNSGFAGLRLFSSCCTAENVPIRDCRNLLSSAFMYLVKLDDDLLQECPFLAEKDGIYSTTVAFIPEKYRIDARRAEEILDRGISQWIRIVGGQTEEAPVHSGLKI
jgi:ATP-dependent Lon protease